MADERSVSEQPELASKESNTLQPHVLQAAPVQPVVVPVGATLEVQQVQIWQGQFPPPDAIERYEATMPGAFDRLMKMAERQQQASIESSAEARAFLRADNQRGHYLGFAVTVLALLGAVLCAYLGQPVIAGLLVSVPVLAVAKALIDSARPKQVTTVAVATPPIAATPIEDQKPDNTEQQD